MFAYCRNNPVNRVDASGTADLCYDNNEDDGNPLNDFGPATGGGGGASGGNFTGGGYGGSSAGANSGRGVGESSFRSNLQKFTGENGASQHAHHVFPKSFLGPFSKIGINVHDPENGAWWEAQSHLQNSYEYNQWWKAFFLLDDITATDAKALAKFLAQLFGFDW